MPVTRRTLLTSAATLGLDAQVRTPPETDRDYWLRTLRRVADPVLIALSQGRLKADMPVEGLADRPAFTHLEALGRLLAGIAPWLASGNDDGGLRARYCELARTAIAAAVDPASPDRMNFSQGQQPVVDAAFLVLGILRAPVELWQKLEDRTKRQLLQALISTRVIQPGFNNWLLFSAMVEAFLAHVAEPWDAMRIDYAIRQHEQWYRGDGMYGDGPQFHWDYYNSFVIQPMLLQVLDTMASRSRSWLPLTAAITDRARRYAAIEERFIAPDGSFPAIGRSLAYRCGAFHHLAAMALRRNLPDSVKPEQVRGALTAVIRRTLDAPGTFDDKGWLRIGLCGHQPTIGESYISTGSLYLCATAFLPLGLPARDPFWTGPAHPWTSVQVWSGASVKADHAI